MLNTKSEQYIHLLQTFPPRPIKSEEEFYAVQKMIDALLDSDTMTQEQQDYLNLLGMIEMCIRDRAYQLIIQKS